MWGGFNGKKQGQDAKMLLNSQNKGLGLDSTFFRCNDENDSPCQHIAFAQRIMQPLCSQVAALALGITVRFQLIWHAQSNAPIV